MRKSMLVVISLFSLIFGVSDATGVPETIAAAYDYPELRIEFVDGAFHLPARVSAGRTLLTLDVRGDEPVEADLIRLPDDRTLADLEAVLAGPAGSWPDWVYDADFPGGVMVTLPGRQNQAIVDLDPGRYAVVSFGSSPQFHQSFEVVAGADASPAATVEPEADLAVELRDFAIIGLPDRITPGRHVWKVTNTGKQPHVLILSTAPAGATAAQLLTIFSLVPGATPPPDLGVEFSDTDFGPAGGLGELSTGRTAWVVVDLPSGSYLAACFVPDRASGTPHAFMGMLGVFTVEDGTGAPVS